MTNYYYLDLGFYDRGDFVSHGSGYECFTNKAEAIKEARKIQLNFNEGVQIFDEQNNVIFERGKKWKHLKWKTTILNAI